MVRQVRHARRPGGHPGRAFRGLDRGRRLRVCPAASRASATAMTGVATFDVDTGLHVPDGLTGCFTETAAVPFGLSLRDQTGAALPMLSGGADFELRRRRVRPVERHGQRTRSRCRPAAVRPRTPGRPVSRLRVSCCRMPCSQLLRAEGPLGPLHDLVRTPLQEALRRRGELRRSAGYAWISCERRGDEFASSKPEKLCRL